MLKAKLVVVGGDAKAAEVRLKLPTVIGRGKEAGLTVPHGLVSRRHTEIFEKNGRLFVRDLGSLNGTYVNNTKIESEQPLEPNQLLTLGNITFRAVYELNSTDGESVAFEEIHETATQHKQDSLSEVVSFNETVPLDSLRKSEPPLRPENSLAKESPVQPVAANEQAGPDFETVQDPSKNGSKQGSHSKPKKVWKETTNELSDSAANVFSGETEGSQDAMSDTDKSFVDTDDSLLDSKFLIGTEDVDPASKSVLESALEELPAGQAAASFVGGIEVSEDAVGPTSQIDPVEIDLGADEQKKKLDADSSLGSFLKKLPR